MENTPSPCGDLPTRRMRAAQIAVAAIALVALTWGIDLGVDLGVPVWAVAGLSTLNAALVGVWLTLEARPVATAGS